MIGSIITRPVNGLVYAVKSTPPQALAVAGLGIKATLILFELANRSKNVSQLKDLGVVISYWGGLQSFFTRKMFQGLPTSLTDTNRQSRARMMSFLVTASRLVIDPILLTNKYSAGGLAAIAARLGGQTAFGKFIDSVPHYYKLLFAAQASTAMLSAREKGAILAEFKSQIDLALIILGPYVGVQAKIALSLISMGIAGYTLYTNSSGASTSLPTVDIPTVEFLVDIERQKRRMEKPEGWV